MWHADMDTKRGDVDGHILYLGGPPCNNTELTLLRSVISNLLFGVAKSAESMSSVPTNLVMSLQGSKGSASRVLGI